MTAISRFFILIGLVAMLGLTSACNTIEGLGDDWDEFICKPEKGSRIYEASWIHPSIDPPHTPVNWKKVLQDADCDLGATPYDDTMIKIVPAYKLEELAREIAKEKRYRQQRKHRQCGSILDADLREWLGC